jgi:hypothetical protein
LLSSGSPDPLVVTRALVALHSTDPASVHLAASGRGCSPADGELDRALYQERSLVRMLGMRRTMFVVAADFAPVVHASATRTIAARERTRLVGFIEQGGVAVDGAAFLARHEDEAMAALVELGEAYGSELSAAVPGLRQPITIAGGQQSLTTRVLFLLAADGRIVRGRPRGSWLSSQYRWSPAAAPPPSSGELPTADAQVELARAYLASYGPATTADLKWWTGWTAGETKRALASLQSTAVELADGTPAWVLAEDTEPVAESGLSARLLPALDPSVMGWSRRDFYLAAAYGDSSSPTSLFDHSGNPGPTVWWCGRIVGGWAQRTDGRIAIHLFEDVGGRARAAIDREAARTTEVLKDVRVTPRFRTALERSLVS